MKPQAARYRLNDLLIDTGTRRVTRDGVDLGITGLSFDLLLEMGRVAPNLMSVDALMETVWPGQVVSAETLTQRIKLLRQLLGDSAADPRYVASRRGHGYRLMSAMTPLPIERSQSTRDNTAYELYLQARSIARGTQESTDEALRFLDQALSRDPGFAQALAYRALLQAGSVPLSGAPRGLLARAEHDALRALSIDPELPDAYVASGLACVDRRCWVEAETNFLAARELAPDNAFVNNMYALTMLRPTGRLRQACTELTETHRLLPADGFTAHELALTHSLLGNDAEALRFAHLAQVLAGVAKPHWDLLIAIARAEARRGRFAEAAAQAAKALSPTLRHDGGAQAIEAFYSALAGASQASRACVTLESFAHRLDAVGVDGRTRIFFVTALALLGALDAAYGLIDRLLHTSGHSPGAIDLSDLWLPEMRTFRADNRFERMVQRLGFTEYWRRYGPPDDEACARS